MNNEVISDKLDRVTDRLSEVAESLSETGKVVAALTENVKANQAATSDQEGRIRVLESWQQRLMPILALGAMIIGGLVTSLSRYLFGV